LLLCYAIVVVVVVIVITETKKGIISTTAIVEAEAAEATAKPEARKGNN